jgi:hypothetical protein
MDPILDRREPTIWKHYEKWPARKSTTLRLDTSPSVVEAVLNWLRTDNYRRHYDQGQEGACVGFGESWMMTYYNREAFDPFWLYYSAQAVDEWPETPPEGGTSLDAAFRVLHTQGHRRFYAQRSRALELKHGISEYRWASSVDEIRAAISLGAPVGLGINWYDAFYDPAMKPRVDRPNDRRLHDYWIGEAGTNWGRIAGGHYINVIAASDKRQAFGLCNTWGYSYPLLVWLPYSSVERLLNENGEAGIVTDRPKDEYGEVTP